jgi:hypothetical protein
MERGRPAQCRIVFGAWRRRRPWSLLLIRKSIMASNTREAVAPFWSAATSRRLLSLGQPPNWAACRPFPAGRSGASRGFIRALEFQAASRLLWRHSAERAATSRRTPGRGSRLPSVVYFDAKCAGSRPGHRTPILSVQYSAGIRTSIWSMQPVVPGLYDAFMDNPSYDPQWNSGIGPTFCRRERAGSRGARPEE